MKIQKYSFFQELVLPERIDPREKYREIALFLNTAGNYLNFTILPASLVLMGSGMHSLMAWYISPTNFFFRKLRVKIKLISLLGG